MNKKNLFVVIVICLSTITYGQTIEKQDSKEEVVNITSEVSQNSIPLYVVDDVPQSDDFTLDPNKIEKIEVLRNSIATSIYGSRGKNGVILITLKTDNKESATSLALSTAKDDDRNKNLSQPLYVVDGIPQSENYLPDYSAIEKIEVLNDGFATATYGAKGKNGVLIVTTKTGSGVSVTP